MKLEVLVQYLANNTINLTPAFQRGRVWKLKNRQSLLKNILQNKPIPAVFLYKEASGSQYSYNILDGKQRLESILLFVGDQHKDFHVPSWKSYFFSAADKAGAHFNVEVGGVQKKLKDLSDGEILKLRDYTLSVIEIDFDDTTTLDEIIQLFVDINQQGVSVDRFDVVKAIYRKDPLLQQIFRVIAQKQKRRNDVYYKLVKSDVSFVLKNLDVVRRMPSANNQVDKMWERLFEFSLFCRSAQHRKPVEILKELIRAKKTDAARLTTTELARVRRVFRFIATGYRVSALAQTRWATDQTHFYILVTALLNLTKTMSAFDPIWYAKLIKFDKFLTGGATAPKPVRIDVKNYIDLSLKQTTDPAKRKLREELFVRISARI